MRFGADRLAVARQGMPKFLSSRRTSPVVFMQRMANRTRYAVDVTGGGRTDVVGFSRMTSADEDRTLARLRALRSGQAADANRDAVDTGRNFP